MDTDNEVQRYKLKWLANAVATPTCYTDHEYYYDRVNELYFTRVRLDSYGVGFELRDIYGLPLDEDVDSDLLVRLELLKVKECKIVEIPKLTVDDKLAIQTLFVKKLEGVPFYEDLLKAISKQHEGFKFVLDSLLHENKSLHPMRPYWEDYKFTTTRNYVANMVKGFV